MFLFVFLANKGGQILRNSVTFSCLMGKPVRVFKIRYNASKPGLKSQHLTGK